MVRRRTILVLGLSALAVAAAACAPNATQSALEPAGPFAEKAHDLFVPVFWVAVAIFVLVEGMLLLFVIRYRHRKARTGIPSQIHGNTRLEVAWTILPAVILAGVSVPTVATIWDLAAVPEGDVLEVNVLGHQWWWEFDYPEHQIITANELHIPTGRPVYLTLCAAGFGYADEIPSDPGPPAPSACQPGPPDGFQPAGIGASVIHSFWVPALAGTTDVIPRQTNHMTIQADEPGTYPGQCKEFCGFAHADMKFTVVAHTPAAFEAWVARQQAEAASPEPGSDAAAGLEVFLERRPDGACTDCHAVAGLEAPDGAPLLANGGPNLTHFASRTCFAGCILETNEENLRRWLDDPFAVKYGSWMPEYDLTGEEIDQLVAYLLTLT
ncbi:MAG: cytochrome c oxidase subunit II [Actinobacteria bacterium]|nr:cytochrome c oxidase subunit II [Actinomycetota bacterium]